MSVLRRVRHLAGNELAVEVIFDIRRVVDHDVCPGCVITGGRFQGHVPGCVAKSRFGAQPRHLIKRQGAVATYRGHTLAKRDGSSTSRDGILRRSPTIRDARQRRQATTNPGPASRQTQQGPKTEPQRGWSTSVEG